MLKSHEEFVKELFEKNPDVEVLSTYSGAKSKISVLCKKCGIVWETTPNSLLIGSGCPECNRKNIYEVTRKPEQIFLDEMRVKNPTIEVLGKYVSSKSHIEVRCRVCGKVWDGTPCHLIRGHGCPECANMKRREALINRKRK